MGRGCLQTAKVKRAESCVRGKVGASVQMPKSSLAQQPQGSRESKRPTVPLGLL